jgi:hypothetical protein
LTRYTARTLSLLALLVVFVAGCASSPGATTNRGRQSQYSYYLQVIEQSAKVHHSTMFEAGRANGAGVMTDAQLERVRVAGRAVEVALRTAKVAVEAWIVADLADTTPVDQKMSALRAALSTLLLESTK